MDKRWTLFLMMTLVIYLIFMPRLTSMKRGKETPGQETPVSPSDAEAGSLDGASRPTTGTLSRPDSLQAADADAPRSPAASMPGPKAGIIPVRSSLYEVDLTTRGGRPLRWDLVFPGGTSRHDTAATHALSLIEYSAADNDRELPLEVTFRELNSRMSFNDFNRMIFTAETRQLPNGDTEVLFTSPELEGLQIQKRYLFRTDSYLVDLDVTLRNNTESDIRLNDEDRGLGLSWGPGLGVMKSGEESLEKRYSRSFFGPEKGNPEGIKATDREQISTGEYIWGGLNTRFLVAAIIPMNEKAVSFRSVVRPSSLIQADGARRKGDVKPASITLWLGKAALPPNGENVFSFQVFVGPRKYQLLKNAGHNLERVMFYTHWGWMQWLCIILLYLLVWLNGIMNNYGLAIIGLTILVRAATFPLTYKGMKLQAKAMAEQVKIRPYMEEINQKYKDNPQMKNKKLMELYKEHGINPLGFMRGCLPMLLQMPIFIALYFLLSESFELRSARFLWISDLSGPDILYQFATPLPLIGRNLNILPVLMGLSQVLVSKYTSTAAADPNQKTMMYFFPIFFTFILYNLPSGLILYWLISNLIQAAQQIYINAQNKRERAAAA